MPRLRSLLAHVALAGALVTLGASVPALPAGAGEPAIPDAAATPEDDSRPDRVVPASHAATTSTNAMTFLGRGWGHGRGMSQYGAQGYATEHGWTSGQILDHFYGASAGVSHAGQASAAVDMKVDPDAVRIRLMALNGKATLVQVANGATLSLAGLDDQTSPADVVDPGGLTAVRLTSTPAGEVVVESAQDCAGPWEPIGTDGRSGSDEVTITVIQSESGPDEELQVCRDDNANGIVDTIVWYSGAIRAFALDIDPAPDAGVTQRTVNITTIEDQLRSVVPRESPASWHRAALEAQAVSARSYALAGDTRHGWNGIYYADTCDTTLCQVYGGSAVLTASAVGGVSPVDAALDGSVKPTPQTAASTDEAIAATAGLVRLSAQDRISRTEFHSTSGGWTAGGTYPAVEDLGDVISPRHTWKKTFDLAPLEGAYGGGSSLLEIEVLSRNGHGADGGRVLMARLHFDNASTRDVTGDTVRSKLGMWSNWFSPACGEEMRYLEAVFELFVERDPGADEVEAWCGPVRAGDRKTLTEALSVTDEWAGVQIANLYVDILGRDAEDDGRAFWLGQVAEAGLMIEEIAAEFYGSAEYFWRSGKTNDGFLGALYLDLLGREAEGDGRDFWLNVLDTGTLTRTEVADEFYASIESRSDRVDSLYHQILDRGAEPGGRDFWAEQLLSLGDVALAAELAASEEFYWRAIQGIDVGD